MNGVLQRGMRRGALHAAAILLELVLIVSLVLPGAAYGATAYEWGDGVLVAEDAGMPWQMTQVIPDKQGNIFVVWGQREQWQQKLYVQKVGPDGAVLWENPVLATDIAGMYFGYFPVVESNGDLIFVWTDNRNKRKPDVFAQKIDANGKRLWGENGVAVYVGPGAQDVRSVVSDRQGGAVVVWRDDERPGFYMQRIGSGGAKLWQADGVSVNELAGIEPEEQPYYDYGGPMEGEWINIADDGQGGVYLSWSDVSPYYYDFPAPPGQERPASHIYVQRVNRDGHRMWASNIAIEFKGSPYGTGMNQLMVGSDNAAIITWTEPNGDPIIERKHGDGSIESYPNPNINFFATKVTPDGAIAWDYSRPLLKRTGEEPYYEPTSTMALGDGLLVAWQKMKVERREEKVTHPDGTSETVHSEMHTPIGLEMTGVDGSGRIAWQRTVPSGQDYAYPMDDKSGGFFLVTNRYVEAPYPSESTFIQRYDADGNALWQEGAIKLSSGPEMVPAGFVPDGAGGVYAAWRTIKQDPNRPTPDKMWYGPYPPEDTTQSDIYVQHIVDDGSGWPDVALDDWSFSYIDGLAKMEAVGGYGDGSFRPDEPVTRAEFAKMIVFALGLGNETTASAGSLAGTDAAGHWSAQYLGGAVAAGLMRGYPDGSFKPDAKITRAEAATIIYRAKDVKVSASSQAFSDVPADHWACASIEGARKLGVVSGYPDGTFRPLRQTTRAEAAKMIYNITLR